MIVVAIDSATDRLSVAAGALPSGPGPSANAARTHPGVDRAVRTATGARRHTAVMLGLVEESLSELGISLREVEGIALSDGPGSFTGLRVAAAWAKGVIRARGVSLWTASTLLVRVYPHARAGEFAFGVGTALRGEIYLAGYQFGEGGTAVRVTVPPTVLRAGADPPAHPADLVVGGLDPAVARTWSWAGSPRVIGPPEGLPNASALLDLMAAGSATRIDDPAGWEPGYGRPAEAQVKWERSHGQPLFDPAGRRS
jgi:tRNA threonylcarbamoyladenosine biosynthesis protein TsaB